MFSTMLYNSPRSLRSHPHFADKTKTPGKLLPEISQSQWKSTQLARPQPRLSSLTLTPTYLEALLPQFPGVREMLLVGPTTEQQS